MKPAAVFGMVVVVTASAWTYLAAQSTPTSVQKALNEPAPPVAGPSPLPLKFAPQSSAPLTPLQQRYIDLATQKARLMNEEQLQQAVNQFDHDVQELNAWSKVEETARQLRELIDKHPQTRAAEAARSALEAIEKARPRPGFSAGKHFEREKFQSSPFGAEAKTFDNGT